MELGGRRFCEEWYSRSTSSLEASTNLFLCQANRHLIQSDRKQKAEGMTILSPQAKRHSHLAYWMDTLRPQLPDSRYDFTLGSKYKQS